ncbi:MAG: hypothetical protein E6471_20025, partial [Bradyrhizobium sp.]|nr:hypothetical protein [Bradyrhizobium sp.]
LQEFTGKSPTLSRQNGGMPTQFNLTYWIIFYEIGTRIIGTVHILTATSTAQPIKREYRHFANR